MPSVLVDTSVWIRFLTGRPPFAAQLDGLLEREEVLAHALVYGELLIGDSGRGAQRKALLSSYTKLPHAPNVTHDEIVDFVVARELRGQGIGWIDAQLIASALVAKAAFWTADENLRRIADRLKLKSPPT
jgi:predicted nucleic acid-binding protein